MILVGLVAWLLSLVIFMMLRRWSHRDRWRTAVVAVLCFTPSISVFRLDDGGWPAIMFLPIGLAAPALLLWPPVPDRLGFFLTALYHHLHVIAVVGLVAFLISGRRAVTDTGAPSLNGPVDPDAATGMRRLIEPLIVLVALPAVVFATGFYPWRDAPTILRPVPLWLTASVIFMCAVIAHLSTSALLGKHRADRSPWKTLPVAFILFMLLRSFVAVVVFRVLDSARHLP